MGRSKAAFELESRPICLVSILGGDKRMNSTKSCRHTTFSDIRSNALNCGLLLAFILLVFPMNMTDAVEEEDKRAGFVGMRGKKDATFYDLYGGGGGSDYNSAVAPDSDAELLYQLKRSGFVGMRGKKMKSYLNTMKYLGYPGYPEYAMSRGNSNLERNSRSNSGFVGMRG